MTRAESYSELIASGKVPCAQAVLTAFCEDLCLDLNASGDYAAAVLFIVVMLEEPSVSPLLTLVSLLG
jgi:hypothetical protein